MASKPPMLGGTAIKPVERHGMEAIRYFFHNPDTGEIMTRTPLSWLLITVFYVIYYSCLGKKKSWIQFTKDFITHLNNNFIKITIFACSYFMHTLFSNSSCILGNLYGYFLTNG